MRSNSFNIVSMVLKRGNGVAITEANKNHCRRGNSIFRNIFVFLLSCLFCISLQVRAQNDTINNPGEYLTLQQCIDYAMVHQPALNESKINISITRLTNAINLSGWFPQVSASGSLTHYFDLPTVFEADSTAGGPTEPVKSGIYNTATPQINATQTLFNPTLIYAAHSAPLYVEAAKQVTDSTKINLVSSVSNAFYSLLLTIEQIDVLEGDTLELRRSVTDAYHQYIGGIVDETDYEEATITLNNTLSQLKQAIENVVPQYAALKQVMGYAPEKQFNIKYDTVKMIKDIGIDTVAQLQYENRIEYQQLATAKKLQHELVNYYRYSFLPSINGFYNYTHEFESNTFSNLFAASYPYSSIGLSFSIPIFTGFARLENIRKAKLQEQTLDWSEVDLKSQIYTEYTTALANYKSNLYTFHIMRDNVRMAQRVFYVVELQYKQGIVAYLNVITAQSNLITSQTGYINALFQTLSSKIGLEKAMGVITY